MDMKQIMEQAQQFQQKMAEVQQELAKQEITSSVGGGMVTAKVNGKNELLSISIDKEVINAADQEMLQDLVVAAVNDAMKKAREAMQGEMSKMTGGLNLPGLSNLFG
jgi:hypothetical protein